MGGDNHDQPPSGANHGDTSESDGEGGEVSQAVKDSLSITVVNSVLSVVLWWHELEMIKLIFSQHYISCGF